MPSLCGSSIFQKHKGSVTSSPAFADRNLPLSLWSLWCCTEVILKLNTILSIVSTQQPSEHFPFSRSWVLDSGVYYERLCPDGCLRVSSSVLKESFSLLPHKVYALTGSAWCYCDERSCQLVTRAGKALSTPFFSQLNGDLLASSRANESDVLLVKYNIWHCHNNVLIDRQRRKKGSIWVPLVCPWAFWFCAYC